MPFTLQNYYLVAARFQRSWGDVCINTFCFNDTLNAGASSTMQNVRSRLDAFYCEVPTGGAMAIQNYLAGGLTSLSYYMREASAPRGTPGLEVASDLFVGAGIPQRGILVPDVAACVSYRAAPPSTKRNRGRVYIGPLAPITLDESTGMMTQAFQLDLQEAARGLASDSIMDPVLWCIASRVGNSAERIVSGYVDRNFDTQRRRDPGSETYDRSPDAWSNT